MTLADRIVARIKVDGPITVADYMAECLLHPTLGYYTMQNPIGASGDFITAPEISQMFGEIVGLCLAQAWLDQGAPKTFTLLELGPGRGTLMSDILRATRAVPGFHASAQIHLLEASPRMRTRQQETLPGATLHFIDDIAQVPKQPLWCVANEFFDALPIRQFQRAPAGWREKRVGHENGTLAFGHGPVLPQVVLDHRLEDTEEGDVVEWAPAAFPICAAIGTRITTHGGAALIIDYGDWRSKGDTLQAVRAHDYAPVLENPGKNDLTAQVDFEALATAAACAHTQLTPQGLFLERLGITQRAQSLASKLEGDARAAHIFAHRRLTHPDEMGNLFKILGLYPRGTPPPAGLDI
ncbi:MAG: class I SAM-dependent methyltransferase [Roseobacter sp.]